MNFLPMQYFTEVVKAQSISRAASRLHITQQTLSSHIAALEKELGCTLFQRRPHFALTYAGRVFYDYACRFSNLYRSMQQEFQEIAQQETGELSIGVAHTRGRYLLTPVLAAFRQKHPHISLHLVESTNADLIDRLLNDKVDLIIVNLTEDNPLLSSRQLYDEEMSLLVPASLLAKEEQVQLLKGNLQPLCSCPFLMNRQEDIAGRIGNMVLEKNGIRPHVAIASENMETLLDLCLAGEGACFATKKLTAKVFAGKDRSHLLDIPLGVTISIRIAWLNKPYVSRSLLDFVDICVRQVQARTNEQSKENSS